MHGRTSACRYDQHACVSWSINIVFLSENSSSDASSLYRKVKWSCYDVNLIFKTFIAHDVTSRCRRLARWRRRRYRAWRNWACRRMTSSNRTTNHRWRRRCCENWPDWRTDTPANRYVCELSPPRKLFCAYSPATNTCTLNQQIS